MKEEIVRETNKALRLQSKNSFNQDPQPEITTEDLIHKSQVYNWGMKNKNPIDKVPFIQNGKVFPIYYREKNAPLEPQMYNEFHIRLYCKQRFAKNEARYVFYVSLERLLYDPHKIPIMTLVPPSRCINLLKTYKHHYFSTQ